VKRPFELRLAGVALSATEGQIDVRSQAGRPTLVRVVSGSPEVRVGDSTWIAAAGQTFVLDGGNVRQATAGEIDEALGWMEGRFVVNGTVRDVVDGFRRWYDADVGIGDNSIADRPAQVVGSLESLTSSIQALEKSAGVKMTWSNRHMLLFRK
jgi:ferric-dicitrate binding protein FerR (iron transport regulator)